MTDFPKPCPECISEDRIFTLKIIPANRTDPYWPKYIPQIKESCGNCGRYIRFATQTPELIGKFNQVLLKVKISL